jgi:sugar phosphate isomerase/epimerase
MTIRRRTFLGTAAAAAAGGVGVSFAAPTRTAFAATPPIKPSRPAKLKLSSQERVMAGRDLNERLDTMEELGFVGLEVGGRGLADRVETLQKALAGRPIKISAICAGFEGWLIADDPAIRQKAVRSMKEILTAAGELGSTGLIIVPAFNRQKSLPDKEARKVLVELLKGLGDHASNAGTRILMEPLNRRECYFLRILADAAAIAHDVDSPGVAMMGDFWHMTWEETSDLGAFISAGDSLRHVHLASRKTRKIPTMDPGDNYVLGLKGLQWIGYQDYISLECGGPNDQQERKQTIAACVQLVRDQWAEASDA